MVNLLTQRQQSMSTACTGGGAPLQSVPQPGTMDGDGVVTEGDDRVSNLAKRFSQSLTVYTLL